MAGHLVRMALLIFIFSAVMSLVMLKKPRVANYITHIFCGIGALIGIIGSIIFLFNNQGEALTLFRINSKISLISVNGVIDSLSAFFLLALFILVFCVSIYSIGYMRDYIGKRSVGIFNFLYAGFIAAMILVFIAENMIFFFMSWEIMSVVSYFLVVFESEKEENCRAGTLYIIMTHIGAALMMIAFMLIYSYTGSLTIGTSLSTLTSQTKNILFILLFIGFGMKAGMIPLHVWLPEAHPVASSNISALMSGIMIKTAAYGIVRFIMEMLGVETWWGILILVVGVISAFLGIAYAVVDQNIKRILAYSSIENIGVIFIGIGISFIAFSAGSETVGTLGLLGALLHVFNHTLFKGGLFMGAGAVQHGTHTKNIEEMGGLIKKMPRTAVLMLCFSLAICGIVPFNGFVSEWLTYQSIFGQLQGHIGAINLVLIMSAAILAMVGALAVVCFVKLFGIAFLGKPRTRAAEHAKEAPISMQIGMGILALLCALAGVFPKIFAMPAVIAAKSVTGTDLAKDLSGQLVMMSYSDLEIQESAISPLIVLLTSIVIVLVTVIFLRAFGKTEKRTYITWDCGFNGLTKRMQYSATGFSKPLRIVFRLLYRPSRKLEVTPGESDYYPLERNYQLSTEPIFEKYIYRPLTIGIQKLSDKARETIQTGSTQRYLFYLLITILVMLVYNRLD